MEKTILTAIVVAAASFILQKTLNNLIYGCVIFLTRPFKKGDKISIQQSGRELASGNVIKRGVLHIHIQDYNRNVHIIPNSVLESCTIVNSDFKSGVNYINHIEVDFDSDIKRAKEIILDAVLNHPSTENTEENTHLICKFDVNGIIIEYNVRTPDTATSFDVCSAVLEEIILKVQEEETVNLKRHS